jgi:hypothetical protein
MISPAGGGGGARSVAHYCSRQGEISRQILTCTVLFRPIVDLDCCTGMLCKAMNFSSRNGREEV